MKRVLFVAFLAAPLSHALEVSNANDSGTGSLRQALIDTPTDGTVTFGTSINGAMVDLASTLTIPSGKTLTVDASNLTDGFTLNGQNAHRILSQEGTATLINLSLIDGLSNTSSDNTGGAIYNTGTLTLDRCHISSCNATYGGGIVNAADAILSISNSTLAANSAVHGGGVYNRGSIVSLTQSTITGNSAQSGGGIYNFVRSTVNLTQSTLTGNSAARQGGGIFNSGGTVNLTRSIVAGNLTGGNFDGSSINDNGNNLTSGNPLLAPLGDYGGPTPTMPPLPGSPAIDAVIGNPPTETTEDQRGAFRSVVIGGGHGLIDIGAVEFQGSSDLLLILPASWAIDHDGDGNSFGIEYALGTDPSVADFFNARNPILTHDFEGNPLYTFGYNEDASYGTVWRVTRSTDLAQGSFQEIFRFDGIAPTPGGPDANVDFNIGVDSISVTDRMPPPGKAFYRFEAITE